MGDRMSIHDERDLRAQLGVALDAFTPDQLPLNAVVRQGRSLLVRRRIMVAACLVILAAAAVAGPTLAHQLSHRVSPTAPRYRVTVNPPGPGAPKGLIATGSINRVHWQMTAFEQRQSGQPNVCVQAYGDANCSGGEPPRASDGGDPFSLYTGWGPGGETWAGIVRSDVAYLRVDLSNGQTLTLRPVAVFGRGNASFVGFAVPFNGAITRITAYSVHAELAYAVPFTAQGALWLPRWLRPGEPALPRPATYKIGSGTTDGNAWSVYLYTGPWGICANGTQQGNQDGMCAAGPGRLAHGQAAHQLLSAGFNNTIWSFVMAASPAVRYLVVRSPDGHSIRVRTHRYDGARLAGFVVTLPGNKGASWTAYAADGRKLGSGVVS